MARTPDLKFWSRMIQAAAAVILALSCVLLLAPETGAFFFNLVYYQQRVEPVAAPETTRGYIYFVNGIIGAVMTGWMTGIILVARGPFEAGQKWAWDAIAVPLGVWFVIDCAFTIAHGVWGNLVLNIGTALLFAIPLTAARKRFRGGE